MPLTNLQKKKTLLLLLEEIDDEELLMKFMFKKNQNVHDMFQTRNSEGFFSVLIEKHLFRDQRKFREFFRLSYDQFTYVLNLIEDDIKCNAYNRHKEPINPAEKLAFTLR